MDNKRFSVRLLFKVKKNYIWLSNPRSADFSVKGQRFLHFAFSASTTQCWHYTMKAAVDM